MVGVEIREHVERAERAIPVPLWDTDQLAAYLGVPKETVYQWSHRRIGPPAIRVGRYLRYRPADVERWLDSQVVAR